MFFVRYVVMAATGEVGVNSVILSQVLGGHALDGTESFVRREVFPVNPGH
jgi:hypothetical protein